MTMYVVNMLCVNMYVVYKYVLMIANIHVHNNPYVHNHHAYNIHVHNNPIVHNQHVWIINIFYKIVFGIYKKKFEKFASALRAEATLYIGRVAFLISSCIMENFPWNMPVYVHAY